MKLGTLFIVALIIALVGCDIGTDMIMDMMPAADGGLTDAMEMVSDNSVEDMMSSVDTETTETMPVKLVWLVNYPVGGKAAYLEWVESVAPILLAPEEVNRIASYDNARGENPHRLIEYEFDSYVDAAIYLSRPEIAAILEAVPDYSSEVSFHVFVQRSDHSKDENATRRVKLVYLIDYPLGGKDAYLQWVASVSPTLASPEQVKRIAAYDNIHGVSPHRFVEFEFESIEQANTYLELEAIHATTLELPNRASRAAQLLFEQRSDYDNE